MLWRIILFFLCSQTLFAQTRLNFPVYDNLQKPIHFAFTGGLNCPQFSRFTSDGQNFIFVYDKSDGAYFCLQNDSTFVDCPFTNPPKLDNWALFAGANLFFTQSNYGITRYSFLNGNFTLVDSEMLASQYGDVVPIYNQDVPSIIDVDYDGDLDIISFDITGTRAQWYRNYVVERSKPVTDFDLTMDYDCWGEFEEKEDARGFVVEFDPRCETIARKTSHSGGVASVIECTGDSLYDVIISDPGYDYARILENIGAKDRAKMRFLPANDSINATNVAGFVLDKTGGKRRKILVSPQSIDEGVNVSTGVQDVEINCENRPCALSASPPLYQTSAIETGSDAVPLIFTYIGVEYLLVSGRDRARLFTITREPSVVFNEKPIATLFSATPKGAPAFGNIDATPEPEFLFGNPDGTVDIWVLVNGNFAPTVKNALRNSLSTPIYLSATPCLFDYDRDGDLDILVGGSQGRLFLYRNEKVFYRLMTENYGAINVANENFTGLAKPAIFNIDGINVLFVGSITGYVHLYRESDSPTSIAQNLGKYWEKDFGENVAPFVWDYGKNKKALFIGGKRGGVETFDLGRIETGVEDFSKIEVYPNPVTGGGGFTLNTSLESKFALFDATGRRILQGTTADKRTFIELVEITSGYYYLQVIPKEGGGRTLTVVVLN